MILLCDDMEQQKASVIISAYNEEATLAPIIFTAKEHPLVGEVIVVDDGSSDQTALIAKQAGAKIIRHRKNKGKAAAMESGVKKAKNEVICFLDADLQGLSYKALSTILNPVLSRKFDMFVGICGRKSDFMNSILEVSPVIGGQRALTKTVWKEVPHEYKENFQIELALNYFTKKNGKRMGYRVIRGLSQVIKEEKRGIFVGFWQRMGMIRDLLLISCRLYVVYSLKLALVDIFRWN